MSNSANEPGRVNSIEENNCSFMTSFKGGKSLTQVPWWRPLSCLTASVWVLYPLTSSDQPVGLSVIGGDVDFVKYILLIPDQRAL